MHTIAWTRRFGQARVFCLESGHDRQTFGDPNYRQVVARGIRWVAGRI
jgi:type 1 glutamine amidotransferase